MKPSHTLLVAVLSLVAPLPAGAALVRYTLSADASAGMQDRTFQDYEGTLLFSGGFDYDPATGHGDTNVSLTIRTSGFLYNLPLNFPVTFDVRGHSGQSGNMVVGDALADPIQSGLTEEDIDIRFLDNSGGPGPYPLLTASLGLCGPAITWTPTHCDGVTSWYVRGSLAADPVPEPGSLALLAGALGMLLLIRRPAIAGL